MNRKILIEFPADKYDEIMQKYNDGVSLLVHESLIAHGTPLRFCNDCISREEARSPFDLVQQDDLCMSYDDIDLYLAKLPSVIPEQQKGEWLNERKISFVCEDGSEFAAAYCGTCSNCGRESYISDFCPNCGSDTRKYTKKSLEEGDPNG